MQLPDIAQPGPLCIGLMADSHGDATGIDAAARCFLDRGCSLGIHLGDIGDTTRPATLEACLDRLAAHGILPIRGNNDHTLLLNQSQLVSARAMAIIRQMPLTRQIGAALLAHSLPFAAAMGPRCMLEDMRSRHIRRFFQTYPGRPLFRGHSHRPEIVRPRGAAFTRERMQPGRTYPLQTGQSAVVTCGALFDGLCLVWHRDRESIELIALDDSDPLS